MNIIDGKVMFQSSGWNVSLPDASDVLVGKSTTDELKNKTIIDSSNIVACDFIKTSSGIIKVSDAVPREGSLYVDSNMNASWKPVPNVMSSSSLQIYSGTFTTNSTGGSRNVNISQWNIPSTKTLTITITPQLNTSSMLQVPLASVKSINVSGTTYSSIDVNIINGVTAILAANTMTWSTSTVILHIMIFAV